jgi:hypothetical protein
MYNKSDLSVQYVPAMFGPFSDGHEMSEVGVSKDTFRDLRLRIRSIGVKFNSPERSHQTNANSYY